MGIKKVGIFVGSLRKDAFTKKAALSMSRMFSNNYAVELIDMSNLCMFNQDYDDEGRTPEEWVTFREKVSSLDALLFVTPEYNRSIPAVLKNALDIASRPHGINRWDNKPTAIAGVTPGTLGATMGVRSLRVPLEFLNVRLMMQPEVYLAHADQLFDGQGNLTDERTKKFLQSFINAFMQWIERE
jgi:chromate reductase